MGPGPPYFKVRSNGQAKLIDDQDLQWVHPPRCETIGCRSDPYGPARVDVHDENGALVSSTLTNSCNHVAISGLTANTRYSYSVTVKHELWGQGVRWDWDPQTQGLIQSDRVYRNEFRTLPDPQLPLTEPLTAPVIDGWPPLEISKVWAPAVPNPPTNTSKRTIGILSVLLFISRLRSGYSKGH